MLRAHGMVAYVRDAQMDMVNFDKPKFECGYCEMLIFRVCGARQNFYMFSHYHNLDLDDRRYDCLLTALAAGQAVDVHALFLLVGDLNGHHQEWLGSTTTNRNDVMTFDFATVSVVINWRLAQLMHVEELLAS